MLRLRSLLHTLLLFSTAYALSVVRVKDGRVDGDRATGLADEVLTGEAHRSRAAPDQRIATQPLALEEEDHL